jgi:predicted nucleic acid-binding protein
MRITLDTTILVRTNAKAKGPARELLKVIQQQGARLVLSPFLVDEVQRVLRYPRIPAIYRLGANDILEHVQFLESWPRSSSPLKGPSLVLKDPNDDPVVYTALPVGRMFCAPWIVNFVSQTCSHFVPGTTSRS